MEKIYWHFYGKDISRYVQNGRKINKLEKHTMIPCDLSVHDNRWLYITYDFIVRGLKKERWSQSMKDGWKKQTSSRACNSSVTMTTKLILILCDTVVYLNCWKTCTVSRPLLIKHIKCTSMGLLTSIPLKCTHLQKLHSHVHSPTFNAEKTISPTQPLGRDTVCLALQHEKAKIYIYSTKIGSSIFLHLNHVDYGSI